MLLGPAEVRRNLSAPQSLGCCMPKPELTANVPARRVGKGPQPGKGAEMKSGKDLIHLENLCIRELHLPQLHLPDFPKVTIPLMDP